ncbi:MAG TPA: PP2C family protein-serine/threonine phosphatase [Acidimicrobiales bacterium]
MVSRAVDELGCSSGLVYLADLQQRVLVPLVPPVGAPTGDQVEFLPVDSTIAGRVFQHLEVLTQELHDGALRVWVPLLDGTDRLGVMAATVATGGELRSLMAGLEDLAWVLSELVVSKSRYGDALVRLRRQGEMGLAAEMQWALLPPLTFAGREVAVAGALEPAYAIAGDTVDYAVNQGQTCVAIFDGMGHGLTAAQLAVVAVSAYRNARRADAPLAATCEVIDGAVDAAFDGAAFTTGVLAHLDTTTGLFEWVNAGHPEPLLFRRGRLIRPLQVAPALPFGLWALRPDAHLEVGREPLETGDLVLFYSDGVVEARSPAGEYFGRDRLTDLVVRNLAGGLPASELMRRVVRALLEHQGGQLDDDATLLALEWRTERPA